MHFSCKVWWGTVSLEGYWRGTQRVPCDFKCQKDLSSSRPTRVDLLQRLKVVFSKINVYDSAKVDRMLRWGVHLRQRLLCAVVGQVQREKRVFGRNRWSWVQSFCSVAWLQSIHGASTLGKWDKTSSLSFIRNPRHNWYQRKRWTFHL